MRRKGYTTSLQQIELDAVGVEWQITELRRNSVSGLYSLVSNSRTMAFDDTDAAAFLGRVEYSESDEDGQWRISPQSLARVSAAAHQRRSGPRGSGAKAAAAAAAGGGGGGAGGAGDGKAECRVGRTASMRAFELGELYAKGIHGENWETGLVFGTCTGWSSEGKGRFFWNDADEPHSTFLHAVTWTD